MQAEQIRNRVRLDVHINIFDVFAMLYFYCEPRFGKGGLDPDSSYGRILEEATRLENTVLPSSLEAPEPLSADCRILLASAINSEREVELRLYAILKAIDNAYWGMSARSMNVGNFPLVAQELNLERDLGLVYPKSTSQLWRLTQKGGKPLRKGEDKGFYLRDSLHNLVCLRVPEGYHLDFGVMDASTRFCFPSELGDCKIAFVPLIDEIGKVEFGFRDSADPGVKLFRFDGLSDLEEIAERAVLLMRRASEMGAVVVLFPELCVPEGVRRRIAEGLRANLFPSVRMVVAGSFHEYNGVNWCNVAHVLGPDGQELWQQRKLQPFTFKSYEAKLVPSLAQLSDRDSREDIAVIPKVLAVRDTPLGRVAILICSDLLLPDPHRQMLVDLKVDFIVVPAMSIKLDENYELAAANFAVYCQATTVVCNCCALTREAARSRGDSSPIRVSFAYRPWYKPIWPLECKSHAGQPTSCASQEGCKHFTIDLASWPQ